MSRRKTEKAPRSVPQRACTSTAAWTSDPPLNRSQGPKDSPWNWKIWACALMAAPVMPITSALNDVGGSQISEW